MPPESPDKIATPRIMDVSHSYGFAFHCFHEIISSEGKSRVSEWENIRIFLSRRFYVKSSLEVLKMLFLPFFRL